MKQSILRLFTCLILGVVFCTTSWAQSATIGQHITLNYTADNFNIDKSNFSSSAKSIKVFFDFGEGATVSGIFAYDRYNAYNPDKQLLNFSNSTKRYYTIIISKSEIISEIASNSGISTNFGGKTHTVKVIVTNYDTADGAANDTSEESGIDPNGGSNSNPDSGLTLAQKIEAKKQITNLPTVYLTVPDALNADGTRKDINSVLYKIGNEAAYHGATIQVVDNSGSLKEFTDDKLNIKVRGNSTAQEQGKRPYRLKFEKDEKDPETGAVIASHKHDLIGGGYKKRNWTLITNHKDPSLLRNAITYHIGKAVGMPFCPGYQFVDLVINGEYRGNYMLSDHCEVGKNRVDIDEDTGWFVEAARGDMVEYPRIDAAGLRITIKNPETDTIQVKADLQKYFENLNYYWGINGTPCSDDIFRDPRNGWRKYIDEESLVRFYIGINLTDDYDGFMTVKMYREVDGKLQFGPLWDKDLAYGNWKDNHGKLCEEYQTGYTFSDHIQRFMTDPVFVKKVHDKLHEIVDDGTFVDNIKSQITSLTETMTESQALNQNMWYTCDNYPAATQELADYIENRVTFLKGEIDKQYNALGGDNIVDNTIGIDDPEDPDNTPSGDLGALVDLGEGKYSYTGSASTFKEGTEITITTSTAGTTLSNYITEGTAWNTTKSITLSATDVTKLAANSYTFYMNATGGEVLAVNMKVPAQAATGLSDGKTSGNGILYTYGGDASSMATGAIFNITLQGSNPYYKAYISDENNPLWVEWGYGAGPRNYSYTISEAQAEALKNNNYKINIIVRDGTCSAASFVAQSSGSTTTPKQYDLTLNATEGGTVTGAGEYAEGTTVLIKAIPNDGYKFVKWSDDNTYASRSVTLNEAITLTATFASEASGDDDPFNEQGTRKQLTDLPTIYLDATNINGEWLQAAVEVFDKDNMLYQGTEWKKEGVSKKGNINVAVQYQGSGADDSKNSYRLKFNDKINLLSATGLYKQWVLLANDDDPTMLNNALAKELGDAIGMPWTPGYQFVDLYVNGTYMGTYQLTDRVKAEEGRSLVSGGDKEADWQARFNDNTELAEDGTQDYISGSGVNVIYRNPVPKDITPEALETLKSYMSTYFNSLFEETATNTFANIPDNVDQQQLINWYIAQEILGVYKGFSSIEAYRSITEGAADNLLHFGPLWDSEKGFGNTGLAPAINMSDLNTTGSHKGLMIEYAAFEKMNKIFQYLWTQDWFKSGVKTKWDAIKTSLPTTLSGTITTLKKTIAASQALNAKKWNSSLGNFQTYDAALAATNTYITNRFAYLDKKFNELAGAAHVHSYTAYIDNGDGTHSRKCPTDGVVEEGSEPHTLKTNSELKAHCNVCGYTSTDAIEGAVANEAVYVVKEYGKKNTSYITASSNFTPAANTFYEAATALPEDVKKDNVIWKRADGDYVANSVVITDGTAYNFDAKIHAKEAVYSRSTGTSMWGTMCIPFKIAQTTDEYDIYQLDALTINKAQGTATLTFSPATKTSGELPLVYKRKENATGLTFNGVAQVDDGETAAEDVGYVTVKKSKKIGNEDLMNTSGEWTLYGNVKAKTTISVVDENSAYYKKQVYYFSGDKFMHCTGTVNVAPFRAFYVSTQDLSGIQNVKSFGIAISDDDEATDINDVNIEDVLAIFIEQGGVTLNATKATNINIHGMNGSKITGFSLKDGETCHINLAPGIYVINNKKIIIR